MVDDAEVADAAVADESCPTANTEDVGVDVAAACGGADDWVCASSFEDEAQAVSNKASENKIADERCHISVRLRLMRILLERIDS
jgi:hypothetical protein